MTNWVGFITKVFGAIGQRLLKRWLFEAEFIQGSYAVYIYESGNPPFVNIWVYVRIHNRNSSPTTVYAEHMAVSSKDGTQDDFPLPTVAPFGALDFGEQKQRIDVGGPSTLELVFFSTKYFRNVPTAYLGNCSLEVNVRVAETFGNRREIVGPLQSKGEIKQ